MISEVFHDSNFMYPHGLHILFETVKNSLLAVFHENGLGGLSAVFERSLNELSKVLLVFRRSLKNGGGGRLQHFSPERHLRWELHE